MSMSVTLHTAAIDGTQRTVVTVASAQNVYTVVEPIRPNTDYSICVEPLPENISTSVDRTYFGKICKPYFAGRCSSRVHLINQITNINLL